MSVQSAQASAQSAEVIPDRRRFWAPVVGIFLFALCVNAVAQTGSPEAEMTHDSAHYLELARAMLRGDGFQTKTHWALNIPSPPIPHADTYRAPLFPFLAAALSFLTRDLFTAAKWASVLTGAAIPMLVFLICRRRLGLSLLISLVGATVATLNHHLVISAVRPLTETAYTAAVLSTVFLVTGKKPRPILGGIFGGLSWLLRYQAFLLLPVALIAYAGTGGSRHAWAKRFALFVVGFLVVSGPWMARNVVVAGSPTYTDLKYHVVSSHDLELTTYHYFHGLTPAPEPLDYMLSHPEQTVSHFVRGLKRVARAFPKENAGNVGFMIAATLGALIWVTIRRNEWRIFGGLALFGAANVSLVAISFFDDRHLTSLDPIVAILVAIFIGWLWQRIPGPWVQGATLALVAAGLLWEMNSARNAISPYRPQYFAHAAATRDFLLANLETDDAVMGEKPYYLSWVLDRPAVSLPWCSDEELLGLSRKHGVRYACVGGTNREHFGRAYPGSFLATGQLPAWLRPVFASEKPSVVVYEIVEPEAFATGDAALAADDGTDGVETATRRVLDPTAR